MNKPPRNPINKKVNQSWKMFDQIASGYDRINRVLSLGMDKRWRRKLFQNLPDKKNLHLLDLATGTADQLLLLFEQGAFIETACGIDLSTEMLKVGQKKVEKTPYKDKIKLVHADAQNLPFKQDSFDAATFSFGIRNVPDPLKSLQEIYRSLKPSGKCLILEFSLPPKPIRGFYLLYLRYMLPVIGGVLSKQKQAYTYLNQTIETFPYGEAFATLMTQAGFSKVQIHPMALGAVSLYVGTKA